MGIKELRINVDKRKRIIAISDIHGNLPLFSSLLKKIKYTSDDYLFILGDIINRGFHSLDTIYYVMELLKSPNCYMVTGNHEEDMTYNFKNFSDEEFQKYSRGKNSLLKEFLEGMDLSLPRCELEKYVLEKYKDIFDFFKGLPKVIVAGKYRFGHAGFLPDRTDYKFTVNAYNFKEYNYKFDDFVVVGHFPTSNYSKVLLDCNPIVDYEKKSIFIDGGYGVKKFGQLNAFIIENDEFHWEYETDHSKMIVTKDQENTLNPIAITFLDPYIKVIENNGEWSLIEHISSHRTGSIESSRITYKDGLCVTYDTTNYFLNVKKGDEVAILEENENYYLAKKDGIVGYINRR